MDSDNQTNQSWLDKPLSSFLPKLNLETLLIVIILILAVVSRFYHVDLRVMSHDETNHVVPAYSLFTGKGYAHDPVTHGPMQFHLLALSYFLFGDNDFSSRVPSVVFSIATIAVVLIGYRRYLGKSGALIAGFLFLISPYMLFYGRYTRNEAFVALFGVLTFYAVFRYLEKGDLPSLFLLTTVTALHFTTKETVYIYMAQLLVFLALYFLWQLAGIHSHDPDARTWAIVLSVVALSLLLLAVGLGAYNASIAPKGTPEGNNQPAPVLASTSPLWLQIGLYGSVVGFVILGLTAIYFIIKALGWQSIRSLRSFDLLILVGTLVLPQLAPFPVKLVGWDPLDYSGMGMLRSGLFIGILVLVSTAIGIWWRPREWLANAAVFYSIFTVFYTTFFTNTRGFWTGLVGSLGYWLSQQGVNRGTQPWYYYGLIQVPIYEFLALLGLILAIYYGIRHGRFSTVPGFSPAHQPVVEKIEPEAIPVTAVDEAGEDILAVEEEQSAPLVVQDGLLRLPVLSLLVFWSFTSLLAYSVAGEKMPWLTVHIALPMLLAAGWGLGYLVDTTPWKKIAGVRGVLAVLLLPVLLTSMASVFASVLGATPPFQGNTMEQLEVTNRFLIGVVAMVLSGAGIVWLLNDWSFNHILRLATVTFFALMAVLTARAAYRSSYVNYDTALEYLVYAHAARGPKEILAQVEEISRRTTGGKDIVVAYDNDALYPYWWYLRDYPNHRWFTDKPTRDLREAPIIIASEQNYAKMEPIVKDNFIAYDYMRLWWPNQDYYNLTWERFWYALSNRQMRAAVFNIWLNRDYQPYAELTKSETLRVENWQPSSRFRLYIRKDIIAQIWNYGAAPALPAEEVKDPYEGRITNITPDLVFGMPGSEPGQLQRPRNLRVAPDGTIYVADSGNHRIQHFTAEGQLLQAWGSFGDASRGNAPGGTFNEPWDVAVGLDGSVYVADTWNHRVQKFTADGQFVKSWGFFGQGESPEAFWGPRGLAVDSQGRLYVTDTGNKRIVIFSPDGEFITQFGSAGMDPGQFDEPVGVAVDGQGNVYVADTWNQRIQVFQPDAEGLSYTLLSSWEVSAWFGQSLDNKPYIATDTAGHLFIVDPEGYRVLEYTQDGTFVIGWGDYSTGSDGFGLASGVAVDAEGRVWVSDGGNHRLLRFTMPNP